MINLTTYRTFFEGVASKVDGVNSVHLVTIDQDMSDTLKSIKKTQLPALFIVVPSAQNNTAEVDEWTENNLCLIFLMDKTDPQRRPADRVLAETQPTIEAIKNCMRESKAEGCTLMRDLQSLNTSPETGFYTDYSGWSVSFKLITS